MRLNNRAVHAPRQTEVIRVDDQSPHRPSLAAGPDYDAFVQIGGLQNYVLLQPREHARTQAARGRSSNPRRCDEGYSTKQIVGS